MRINFSCISIYGKGRKIIMTSIKKLLFLFIFLILILKPGLCETNTDYDIGIKLFQGAMMHLEDNSFTQAENQFSMAAEYFRKSGHKELEKLCNDYKLALQHYGNGDYSYNVGNMSKALDEYTWAKNYFELVKNDKMISLSSEKIAKVENEISKDNGESSTSSFSSGSLLIIIVIIILILFLSSMKKSPQGYYHSKEWNTIASNIKRERGYKCQHCGWKSQDGRGLNVHHIVPRSRGGSDEPSNLAVLCKDCHSLIHPHMKDPNIEY